MKNAKVSFRRSVKWGAGAIGRLIKLGPFKTVAKSIRMKLMVSILALAIISIIVIRIHAKITQHEKGLNDSY